MPENQEGSSLKRVAKKVGRVVAAAGVVGIGYFGIDRETKPVSTATSTPTPTPAATLTRPPTLDQDQQIAALQTVVANAKEKREKDQRIADLKATATALAESTPTRTATPESTKTPIPTASPDVQATVAAAEAKRLEALGKRQAEIKATATAEAEATVMTEARRNAPVTKTPQPEKSGQDKETGAPWGAIILLTGLAGGVTGLAVKFRGVIGRGIAALKNRGGRTGTP